MNTAVLLKYFLPVSVENVSGLVRMDYCQNVANW